MIIGEHELIIGYKNSIVSNFSISVFSHFITSTNYIIKKLKKIILYISQKSNSPPY